MFENPLQEGVFQSSLLFELEAEKTLAGETFRCFVFAAMASAEFLALFCFCVGAAI